MWTTLKRRIGGLNVRIAMTTTLMMSSMWCVYSFLLLSLLPLALPSVQVLCMYISTTIIQLVSLPLIMVGQNLLGREAEQRAQQDHCMLMAEMDSLHTLVEESTSELTLLKTIISNQEQLLARLAASTTPAVVPS